MANKSVTTPGAWYQKLCYYAFYDCFYFVIAFIVEFLRIQIVPAPVPNMQEIEKRSGQVAVLIGSPRGLAVGMVKRLVQLDYTVIMGVRNIPDSERRLLEIRKENTDLDFGKITFLPIDLNSLQSVKHFAERVLTQVAKIDLLLCNAATFITPYELTVDGYESQFQINYLSHFYLTQLLLPRLKKTADAKGQPSQIIYSSSCACNWATYDPNELENPNIFTPVKCYLPSRLYLVMCMKYIQKKLNEEGAQVNLYAVHPGIIKTEVFLTAPVWIRVAVHILSRFFRTVQNGADTILWPTLSSDYLHRGGLYMESGKPVELNEKWTGADTLEDLYKRSLQLVGMEER